MHHLLTTVEQKCRADDHKWNYRFQRIIDWEVKSIISNSWNAWVTTIHILSKNNWSKLWFQQGLYLTLEYAGNKCKDYFVLFNPSEFLIFFYSHSLLSYPSFFSPSPTILISQTYCLKNVFIKFLSDLIGHMTH